MTKFLVLIAAAALAGCATTDNDPRTANVRYCDDLRTSVFFKPAPRPVDCASYDRAAATIAGYRAADNANYRDFLKGSSTLPAPGVFSPNTNARVEQEINTHRWFVKP